jgi:hypothetical protein
MFRKRQIPGKRLPEHFMDYGTIRFELFFSVQALHGPSNPLSISDRKARKAYICAYTSATQ